VPQFVKELASSEATLGAEFVWEFEVQAKPLAEFKLTKDNTFVRLDDRITVKQNESDESRYTLVFRTVSSSDMGKYKLTAWNKCGSASSEAELNVSGAPLIVRKPEQEVSYPEKKIARIEFEVAGMPTPECTWFKNGQRLVGDNRVKTEVRQKTIHNLNIQNVQADDVAEYTFVAENEAGKVSETFRLSLSSNLRNNFPEIRDYSQALNPHEQSRFPSPAFSFLLTEFVPINNSTAGDRSRLQSRRRGHSRDTSVP